jgi:hypothetical protein
MPRYATMAARLSRIRKPTEAFWGWDTSSTILRRAGNGKVIPFHKLRQKNHHSFSRRVSLRAMPSDEPAASVDQGMVGKVLARTGRALVLSRTVVGSSNGTSPSAGLALKLAGLLQPAVEKEAASCSSPITRSKRIASSLGHNSVLFHWCPQGVVMVTRCR